MTIEQAKEIIKSLETRSADLYKKLQYAAAEQQNLLRSKNEEISNTRLYALQSFSRDLLDVADNMERCLSSVKPVDIPQDAKQLKTLYDGIDITNKQMLKVFTKNSLTSYEPKLGDKFDPDTMEALMEVDSTDKAPAGTVGLLLRKGYLLRDRVIRAAQVGVARH
jgi:molecular chaperone GrpE